MLIRDLALKEWGAGESWVYALVRLRGGYSLFVCRPHPKNKPYRGGIWTIYWQREPLSRLDLATANILAEHEDLEEFEAQAVLDYYLQTHNPER